MAIFLNFLDGGGAGRMAYRNLRHKDDPPPFAFYMEREVPPFEDQPIPPGFSTLQLPKIEKNVEPAQNQASVYQFVAGRQEGDDTVWDFKLYRYMSEEDAIVWMVENVSPDDTFW